MKLGAYKPYSITELKGGRTLDPKASYFRFAARESALTRDEILFSWITDFGSKELVYIPNGKVFDYYFNEKPCLNALRKLEGQMFKDWPRHLKIYRQYRQRMLKTAANLSKSVKTKDRRKMLKAFQENCQAHYDFGYFVWTPWTVILLTEQEVLAKVGEDFGIINTLEKPIDQFKMRLDAFRMPAEQAARKWGWLNAYNIHEEPYTAKDIRKFKHDTSLKELQAQFKNFTQVRKQFKQYLAGIKDKKLKTRIDMVHTYAYLKTDRVEDWKHALYLKRPFYEYLSSRMPGSTLQDACNLSVVETIAFLKTGEHPPLEELKLRSAGKAMYVFSRNRIGTLCDEVTIRDTLATLEHADHDTHELKGITACRGRVRGKARVIKDTSELAGFKAGEILVAKFTLPSYTPCMARAKAIVTDEGGLTSHAAIVGREYGKPTLVGTKNATRIFKTGDSIEVDADNGIVRKI